MSPRHETHRADRAPLRFKLARLAGFALPLCVAATAANAAAAAIPGRVLVMPFAAATSNEAVAGLGRAVQQSVSADLVADSIDTVSRKQSVDDSPAALAAGREAAARYVVFGNVQQSGNDIRVTGQVIDVQSGRPCGALKVTGPITDFFAMQDGVGRQVIAAISGTPVQPTKPVLASAVVAAAPVIAPQAPQAPVAATPPASAPAQRESYWSEYMDLYEGAPVITVGAYPPTPPALPTPYQGYQGGLPYGGGGYFDGGYYNSLPAGFTTSTTSGLGVVHTQYFNSQGTSIIAPPTGLSKTGSAAAASFYTAPEGPAPLPAVNPPISAYKNPYSRGASSAGLPQRAAPPVLRPGASGSSSTAAAAVRSSGKR